MQRTLYTFMLAVVLSSCEKEKDLYISDLTGSWKITRIQPAGNYTLGEISFSLGTFTFNEDLSVLFKDISGNYTGTWALRGVQLTKDCYTDQNGDESCSYDWNETLHVTVQKTTSPETRKAVFEFLEFADSNHFTAKTFTPAGLPAYEYSFEKQP